MLADLTKPIVGDSSAPRDVLQERQDVIRTFWAAERDEKNRVIRIFPDRPPRPGGSAHRKHPYSIRFDSPPRQVSGAPPIA